MRRKIEIGINILGVLLSIVMVGTGVVFLYLTKSDRFLQYLEAGWSESENAYTLEQLSQAGTMFILPGIIGILIGLLAIFLVKRNYSPKVIGWSLIIVTVIITVISLFSAIPGMFYILAGALALSRKPIKNVTS
ncbi:DUF4064 domain-containing protein [Ureibacillus thermosphaericus]|uniref:Putative membrane protein n=1 Tax=Ureibacillus thermosphaericus TaxID=51173 RepID=A0A840PSZ0_URETH|nr:DUF4064 domain-containing protein [Ureibacillus thermosphaericus]MBB5149589.1 putative membrane protein [Ureibacillus thermosphaericus]NKZ31991.1 DUF4064 domain-containing protein [Ureibacillus thermosphaericus]